MVANLKVFLMGISEICLLLTHKTFRTTQTKLNLSNTIDVNAGWRSGGKSLEEMVFEEEKELNRDVSCHLIWATNLCNMEIRYNSERTLGSASGVTLLRKVLFDCSI